MTAFSVVSHSLAPSRAPVAQETGERQSAAFADTLRQLELNAADMLAMQAVSLTGASVIAASAATASSAVATDAPMPEAHNAASTRVRAGWRDERCRVLAQDARPPESAAGREASIPASGGSPDDLAFSADFVPTSMQYAAHSPSAATTQVGERREATQPLPHGDEFNDASAALPTTSGALAPVVVAAVPPTVQHDGARDAASTNPIRAGAAAAAMQPASPNMHTATVTAVTGAPSSAADVAAMMATRTAGRLEHAPLAAPRGVRASPAAPPASALVVAHVAADGAALAIRVAGLSESSERELLMRLRTELGAHGLRCYSLQLNGAGALPASPT